MPTPKIKLSTPLGQWPAPAGYPELLQDARAIADMVETLAVDFVCTEAIEEMFHGCRARLAWMPIEQLTPGHADTNRPNARKEAQYAKQPLQTMPPILVDEGEIQDGHHRFRVARKAGATGMWCYCIEVAGDA